MILYWVVPYLLVMAPLLIVLVSVTLGGCAMTRTTGDQVSQTRFYADANSRTGDELVKELERREVRAELRRTIDEAQR
ncbi:MAG TPA: hypothetical protein VFL62_13165 [Bradyrhizobium sp.]|uniref:hypothetical protein n=1 Tax=Bradyrhizobium sp. TaxID=376 RepID=UPI002D80BFB9|nr:hypothetical protein [Bradyrhizobium sp.]HET7887171.1 hypothetical protein [Bradyrhizobium sp.]